MRFRFNHILLLLTYTTVLYSQTPIAVAPGESIQLSREHSVTILPITEATIQIGGADSIYITADIDNYFIQNLTIHISYTLYVSLLSPVGELEINVQVSYHSEDAFTKTINEDFIIDTTVLPSIVAVFSAMPLSGDAPFSVQFNNESYGAPILGYSWDFGDGTTIMEENPMHIYQEPGTYTVSLTVFNSTFYHQAIREDYIQVTGTSGIENSKDPSPAFFRLFQNYPNPFNPQTMIRYQLAENSDVDLAVFNLLGQKVTTLASGMQAAGAYTVTFDGSGLASGIYYYSLQASGYRAGKKMILTK